MPTISSNEYIIAKIKPEDILLPTKSRSVFVEITDKISTCVTDEKKFIGQFDSE